MKKIGVINGHDVYPGQLWHRRDGLVVLLAGPQADTPAFPVLAFLMVDTDGQAGPLWYSKDGRSILGGDEYRLDRPVAEARLTLFADLVGGES